MTWAKDRRDEVEMLQHLLREVAGINSGSHCLQRIARCIEMAEKLQATDYNTARPSFMRFVIDEAVKSVPQQQSAPMENTPSGCRTSEG